jgi:ribosomal protein S18 acetylase RimI-like enzyme
MEKEPQTETLPSTFELRQVRAEDCELMFRLQKSDGNHLDQSDAEQVARFEEYKQEFKAAETQVIYVDNQPVGRLRVVRGEEIYIGGIQILPEYRGRGIGTALLKNLIEESTKASKTIRLEVFHNNLQALRLYEKVGFKVIEENDQQKIMVYQPS